VEDVDRSPLVTVVSPREDEVRGYWLVGYWETATSLEDFMVGSRGNLDFL